MASGSEYGEKLPPWLRMSAEAREHAGVPHAAVVAEEGEATTAVEPELPEWPRTGDVETLGRHHLEEPAPETSAVEPVQVPSPPPPHPPRRKPEPGPYDLTPPPALDQSNLVNPVKPAPRKGWRRLVHDVTGGYVNPGESEKELEHERLLEKIRRPLRGDYRIAVMSLKGGVGKTTTTVALGGVFASVRGDRVIAIDANPDLGTLAQRVAAPGPATIRDLLAAEDTSRYTSVRRFTTQAKSRLEVIGSERDPAVSEAFSEDDYRYAIDILQHHYNVMLTDCGTGLMHSAMSGVLDLANTLVLITSPALDGAQSASATLDWLNLHGYEQLAANAVVVISAAHPGQATIDMEQLVGHFRSRARAVHLVPFDRHLSEGATIDLELLSKKTRASYLELAATVAEDFDSRHRHAAPGH
nr:MinD/ParA family protein [Corynebacterium halotolerans]